MPDVLVEDPSDSLERVSQPFFDAGRQRVGQDAKIMISEIGLVVVARLSVTSLFNGHFSSAIR
jgi:hypothetical protein